MTETGTRDPGRVLVTGARGFLGSAVVARLRNEGAEVVATDLPDPLSSGRDILDCDVTDFDEVDAVIGNGDFGTILHCGAVSGPMVIPDRPLDIWRINAGGTVHVLEAARRHRIGRVVICSTTEVYGQFVGRVDETTLPQPASVYGASKLAAEQAMIGYVRQHGLDAAALRLAWIYGPGRRTPTELEDLLRSAMTGTETVLAARATDHTHYLYIDDAVQGLLSALTAQQVGHRIYNISAGAGVPASRVVEIVGGMFPGTTISCSPAKGAHPGVSDIGNTCARVALGFQPVVPLEMGLERYCAVLRG
ncbi:MAG: NAD(P)-dependent oxidoreductase [Paracoccaceae bacterium]